MRIIHIWNQPLSKEGSDLVTYCGENLQSLPKEDEKGMHYAVFDDMDDQYIPDLCEECLGYEGAQMVLLAGTEL